MSNMKTKTLGNSDFEITRIGLGTWAMGGGGWKFSWGQQDDQQSIDAIVKAVDLGINWIDTAAVYGLGHSEVVVGKALKALGSSRRPMVTTKCDRAWKEDGTIYPNLKADNIKAEVDASLKRLDIDVIDMMQLHWPEPNEDIEEGWGALVDCVNAGKIRYLGVSNFNIEQLKRLQAIYPITSLQPPYSMLARGIEDQILPFCAERNIGVIFYSPMYRGLLTGKFTAERAKQLDPDDHRQRFDDFREPRLLTNLELVDALRPIAEAEGLTLAQLAIAWTLRRPEVTAAIVGARRPDQITETAQAGDHDLSAESIEAIEQALATREAALV